MEDAIRELGLYDLIGYLIPGMVATLSILFVSGRLPRASSGMGNVRIAMLVLVAYVSGHILQAVGTDAAEMLRDCEYRTVDCVFKAECEKCRDDEKFKNQVHVAVREVFGDPPQTQVFWLCRSYLQVRGIDGFTETMDSRFAFFRGLTLALLMAGIAFFIRAFRKPELLTGDESPLPARRKLMACSLLFMIFMAVSLYRMKQFDDYHIRAVYTTFYADVVGLRSKAGCASNTD